MFRRIWGLMYRHLALYRRSWPRLLELAYWPVLNMCIWGFTSSFLRARMGNPAVMAGATLLGGVLLWEVTLRSQMGMSISFLEEMWSRNLGHIFVSPLRPFEMAEAGDVTGKRLVHLQCHVGLDTLSWARNGAQVTGLDFSGPAIEAARSLAAGSTWIVVPGCGTLTLLLVEDGRPVRVALVAGAIERLDACLRREWFALGREGTWSHVRVCAAAPGNEALAA